MTSSCTVQLACPEPDFVLLTTGYLRCGFFIIDGCSYILNMTLCALSTVLIHIQARSLIRWRKPYEMGACCGERFRCSFDDC